MGLGHAEDEVEVVRVEIHLGHREHLAAWIGQRRCCLRRQGEKRVRQILIAPAIVGALRQRNRAAHRTGDPHRQEITAQGLQILPRKAANWEEEDGARFTQASQPE
jgi:hypothetical protein